MRCGRTDRGSFPRGAEQAWGAAARGVVLGRAAAAWGGTWARRRRACWVLRRHAAAAALGGRGGGGAAVGVRRARPAAAAALGGPRCRGSHGFGHVRPGDVVADDGLLDQADLLEAEVEEEVGGGHAEGGRPHPGEVGVVVDLGVEAGLLGAHLARGRLAVVHGGDAREGLDDHGDGGEDGALLELAVGAVAEHGREDEREPLAAALAHHLDAHARVLPVAGVEGVPPAVAVVGPGDAGVDVELGPVGHDGEEAEEDGGVVAGRVVLDGLAADEEADEDEEGLGGAVGDDAVERGEEAAPEDDEVDEPVDDGVAALGAEGLVDGVADVDRRAEEGAEAGAEHRADAVDDHRLDHGVVVARGGRGLDARERRAEADDGDDEDDGEVVLHLVPGHVLEVLEDAGAVGGDVARVGPVRVLGVVLGRPDARRELPRVVEHAVDARVRGRAAELRGRVGLLVAVHLDGAVLVLAAADPADEDGDEDRDERDGDRRARPAEVVLDAAEEAADDDEEGHEADDGLGADLDHRVEGEVDEADARHERVVRRRRDERADRRPDEAARGFEDARDEVGGHGDLEGVVGHEAARLLGLAPEDLVEVLGLERLREERRQVDRAQRDEGPRRVDAVGLRRHVVAVLLPREAARHVAVVQVPEEEADGDARDAPLVVERRVAADDRVRVLVPEPGGQVAVRVQVQVYGEDSSNGPASPRRAERPSLERRGTGNVSVSGPRARPRALERRESFRYPDRGPGPEGRARSGRLFERCPDAGPAPRAAFPMSTFRKKPSIRSVTLRSVARLSKKSSPSASASPTPARGGRSVPRRGPGGWGAARRTAPDAEETSILEIPHEPGRVAPPGQGILEGVPLGAGPTHVLELPESLFAIDNLSRGHALLDAHFLRRAERVAQNQMISSQFFSRKTAGGQAGRCGRKNYGREAASRRAMSMPAPLGKVRAVARVGARSFGAQPRQRTLRSMPVARRWRVMRGLTRSRASGRRYMTSKVVSSRARWTSGWRGAVTSHS
ncbi:MAG: hypothetical protein CMN37_08760 [SAR116 cluster bacterium]|nr:hypothetical protein [SAR116 cluster bacterium]